MRIKKGEECILLCSSFFFFSLFKRMGTCEALLGGCPCPPAQQARNSGDESGWHRVLPPLSLTVAAEWTCCCRPAEHSLSMSCGSGHALANRLVLGSLSIARVHITPCLLTHWMATQTTNPVASMLPQQHPFLPPPSPWFVYWNTFSVSFLWCLSHVNLNVEYLMRFLI